MEKRIDISQFSPCSEGQKYYDSKATAAEAWRDCERGDWMLWIAHKLDIDRRTLTRAKALCANTVRHLMKDKRSTDAIDAALLYADGKITENELDAYATRAFSAQWKAEWEAKQKAASATYNATYATYDAASAAAYAASAYAASAYAASADAASAAVAYAVAYAVACAAAYADAEVADAEVAAAEVAAATRKANQLQTANICREVLSDAVFNRLRSNNIEL
jgi:hypothetical protein